jgi:hypothetical protein
MAFGFKNFLQGIGILPKSTPSSASLGELEVLSTDNKLHFHNDASSSPVVTEEHASQGANRLQNKDLESESTQLVDGSDTSKALGIDLSGATTASKMTIESSQTIDRTLILPDADDTLVARNTVDTLTNKTLSSPIINNATADTITSISGQDLELVSSSGQDVIINADGGNILLQNSGSTTATVDSNGISLASGKSIVLENNSQTITLEAHPSANDSYSIVFPADAPATDTVLKYDGTDYVWDIGGGGSGITQLTGDVTAGPGSGSQVATISSDAIDNTKLSNMSTQTFKGRSTAGTGDPEDLSTSQATAMLDIMVGDSGSGGTKGLVPAPASGDAAANKFLKADGTWSSSISDTFDARLINGRIVPLYTFSDSNPIINVTPSAPAVQSLGTDWSPDNRYVLNMGTANIVIYEQFGERFIRTTTPGSLPGQARKGRFSPDGQFFACADSSGSPSIAIYRKSLDTTGTIWTRITNPVTVPTIGGSICWSPDSRFLVLGGGTDVIYVYEKTDYNTFTRLVSPSLTALGGYVEDIDFSSDGRYLAFTHSSSPYMYVYEVNGSTFTKLPDPSILPIPYTGGTRAIRFNPDCNIISIGSPQSNPATECTIFNYEISGSTLTKLSDPISFPISQIFSLEYSLDGSILYVGVTSAPYIERYSVSGTTFTKISPLTYNTSGSIYDLRLSPNGKYLAASLIIPPYFEIIPTADSSPDTTNKIPLIKRQFGEVGDY